MKRLRKILFKSLQGLAMLAVVIGLMAYLTGVWHAKVGARAAAARPNVRGGPTTQAALVSLAATESATGTIRPVYESAVASKIMEKVLRVDVKAGQAVKKDQVLVVMDDQALKAQLGQTDAALRAASATRDQTKIEFDTTSQLYQRGNATRMEVDRTGAAYKTAEAEVNRLQEVQKNATISLEYAIVRSPMNGIVIDKKVNPGDTVMMGQVLLTMYDPTQMQLVARVRESLASRLRVGQPIDVRIDAFNKTCPGQVSEIVPEAESASRSFQVKVTGPCQPGVYAGMSGRLLVPLGQEQTVVVPRQALIQVGQLDEVEAVMGPAEAGRPSSPAQFRVERRAVRLGRTLQLNGHEDVEVLSGLVPGETVMLQPLPAGTSVPAIPARRLPTTLPENEASPAPASQEARP